MKKKASLWISGITTVAMLAVAVGSFAAWDKLSAEPQNFTVTSSNPAVLTVSANKESSKLLLVPSDSITIADKESDEVKVGDFTATLKADGTTSETQFDKSSGATIAGKIDVKVASVDKLSTNIFKVILTPQKMGEEASAPAAIEVTSANANSVALDANRKYDVSVKYGDSIDYDAAADLKGQDVSVDITLTATPKAK